MKNKLMLLTKTKFWFSALLACIILSGCNSGNSNNSASSGSSASNSGQLSISSHYIIPNNASTQITAYAYLTNNSTESLNNLTYLIENNTTGTKINIPSGQCSSISAGNSCTVTFSVNPTQNTGSFNIVVGYASSSTNAGLFTHKTVSVANSVTTVSSKTIGLENIPANQNTGANGITLLAPDYVLSNSNGKTNVIVSALVNSPLIGSSFNTIRLTSKGGTPLNYIVLSNNNGKSSLEQGDMVTFVLSIPSSTNIMPVYVQIGNSESGSFSSISTSQTPLVINLIKTGGILSLSPNSTNLSADNHSQVVTITNSGNKEINDLQLHLDSTSGVSGVSSCGSSLAANSTCAYTITMNPVQAGYASTILTGSFTNGVANDSGVTVNYQGTAQYGLKIASPTKFVSSINQQISESLTITNTGNVADTNINLSIPDNFTLSQSASEGCILMGESINILNAGQSCSLTLTYSGNQITPITQGTISASYTAIDNTYTTSQSIKYQTIDPISIPAIIIIQPNNYVFPSVPADHTSSIQESFAILNVGGSQANNINVQIINNSNGYFHNSSNPCNEALAAEESCSITIKAGPSGESGIVNANLNVSYEDINNNLKIESTPISVSFISPSTLSILISSLLYTSGVAVDKSGNVYVSAMGQLLLLEESNGQVNNYLTLSHNGFIGQVVLDESGNIYVANTPLSQIDKISISNGEVTDIANTRTTAIAVDESGNVYIAGNEIYELSNGIMTHIAGAFVGQGGLKPPPVTGESALDASFISPAGIAVDKSGNVYIADTGNSQIEKLSNGIITVIATNLDNPSGLALDESGNLYIADTGNNQIKKLSNGIMTVIAGSGTKGAAIAGPAINSPLNAPTAVAVDESGNVYIADSGNGMVVKVSP